MKEILKQINLLNDRTLNLVEKINIKNKFIIGEFKDLSNLLLKSSVISIFKLPDTEKIERKIRGLIFNLGLHEGMILQQRDILEEMQELLQSANLYDDQRQKSVTELREQLHQEQIGIVNKKEILEGWLKSK